MTNSQTAHSAAMDDARPILKPGWGPLNIILMVVGFIVFWPLGLAMMAYNIWGHKWGAVKSDLKQAFAGCDRWASKNERRFTQPQPTGNAAFDAYRERELARLEEERAKIEAMRAEFDAYLEQLRRARDQEEFDRFMAARKETASPEGSGDESGKGDTA